MTPVKAEAYAKALEEITANGKQKDFLRAHYHAPHRAMTATMLADSVDYDGHQAINLHYGKIAADLGRLLGQPDEGFALVCEWIKPGELTNSEYILIMRSDFAEGLKLAGWV